MSYDQILLVLNRIAAALEKQNEIGAALLANSMKYHKDTMSQAGHFMVQALEQRKDDIERQEMNHLELIEKLQELCSSVVGI